MLVDNRYSEFYGCGYFKAMYADLKNSVDDVLDGDYTLGQS